MPKYIHYCWFGNKPLPKLAKKCIKSWEKYLPDFKIIKWSEENVNLNECKFIEEAYKNKKWAFVADYARAKALNEMGGIYFDTDMMITKDISKMLENETFLGVEDTGCVAVGVWYEKHKNNYLPNELLKVYKNFKHFDIKKISEYSIPILITKILDSIGFKKGKNQLQILNSNIYIYPRDYFYPYSYNWQNNKFTHNTCMIHYYDASWISLKEKIEIFLVRKLGRKKTFALLKSYRILKQQIKKCLKVLLFPIVLYKKRKFNKSLIDERYINRINNTINILDKLNYKNSIVFYNSDWLGVTSATKELFDNTIDCGEIYRKKDIRKIAHTIISNKINQVIFSSFAYGWKDLALYLKKKNKNLKIKTYWHGSHSQILDSYGWTRNKEIIKLHKKGVIDVMGSCKGSLINFYKKEHFDIMFLSNKVVLNNKVNKSQLSEIKIGLYAAKCDDWRKNMFTQIAAVSLIDNAVIDMVPLNDTALEFSKILGVKITGSKSPLNREQLIERMANNTLNLYITYSECAPMLPLESMENGVVCLTGNNHHYFKDNKLGNYIVVDNEEDVLEIKNKIESGIKNTNKILKLYNDFSNKNEKDSNDKVKQFLNK